MSEREFTIEKGRVPENIRGALEVLETAQEVSGRERSEVLKEQIDNLLEVAFDAESGLSAEQRKALEGHAKNLKDELDREARAWDDMKDELVELGWFKEGEEMSQQTIH